MSALSESVIDAKEKGPKNWLMIDSPQHTYCFFIQIDKIIRIKKWDSKLVISVVVGDDQPHEYSYPINSKLSRVSFNDMIDCDPQRPLL